MRQLLRRFVLGGVVALALALLAGAQVSMAQTGDPFAPPGASAPAAKTGADPFVPPGPTLPARPKVKVVPQKDTVTLEQARAVFAWLASQEDITFRYVEDGCYARTHLMIRRMQAMGLNPGRVWAISPASNAGLYVVTPYGAHTVNGQRAQRWNWHCAATLKVRLADGSVGTCVIDPSLFDRPVILETWKSAIRPVDGAPAIHFTESRFGEAPIAVNGNRYPGTGYHPGADPTEGADAHAVATMAKYKRLEPARR